MKRVSVFTVLVALACSSALAQNTGEAVPQFDHVNFQVAHYIGSRDFVAFGGRSGFLLFLFSVAPDLWTSPTTFNPATDIASEFDIIQGSAIVTDADLEPDPNNPTQVKTVDFFMWVRQYNATFGPPDPGLLIGTTPTYEGWPNLPAPPPPANARLLSFTLGVPELLGPSQLRLMGLAPFDAEWFLELRIATSDSPDQGKWGLYRFNIMGEQNEHLNPAAAPPFADAGADQTVLKNRPVLLDGRQTFSASNIGFDPNDPHVFEKDHLQYTWEWLSGPDQIDPQPLPGEPAYSPLTTVTLDTATTPDNPYVYRLFVQGESTPVPSTALVRIYVVNSFPPAFVPRAVIASPSGPVNVGSQIKLDGSFSFDASGGPLTYHWSQTNELGGPLTPDELSNVFQPLAGTDSAVASWLATKAGTYYFQLVVTNAGGQTGSGRTSVDVVDTGGGTVAAAVAVNPAAPQSADTTPATTNQPAASPGACGAGGLMPLALTPLALLALRMRRT